MALKWLIVTRRGPQFDPLQLPAHYAFLETLRSDGSLILAGPFDDASGGAYLIEAATRADAEAVASRDPLHVHGCSDFELRGWNIRIG